MCSSSVSILTELFVVPETSSIKFLQVRWANHCTWWERSVSLNHTKITINNIYPRQPRYQHKFRHREKLKMVEVKYPKRLKHTPHPNISLLFVLIWPSVSTIQKTSIKHAGNHANWDRIGAWCPQHQKPTIIPHFYRNDNDVSLAWCNYCIWVFRKTVFLAIHLYVSELLVKLFFLLKIGILL